MSMKMSKLVKFLGWVMVIAVAINCNPALSKEKAAASSADNMYMQMMKMATQQATEAAKKEKFDAKKAIDFIRKGLKDVDGITFRTAGNMIIIEGEVVKEVDRNKLEDVCAKFAGNVLNWVTLSEEVRTALAKNVEKLIDVPTVSINLIGDKTIIEGTVNTENERIKINKLVKNFFPGAINMLQVAAKKVLVELKVQIVEMQEEFSRNIGFNYGVEGEEGKTGYVKASMNFNHGNNYAEQVAVSGTQTATTNPVTQPNPKWMDNFDAWFKALQSKGKLKVIAEPRIVTLSGKSASISKGGTLTYLSDYGTDTIDYGLKLDVTPDVDIIYGRVSTKVDVEMSEPGTKVAGADTNLTKTSASTEIMLKNGETIVISGLIKLNESRNRSEIPCFAGIPVIREFLRYREKRITDSKMLVFVTPTIVETFDEGMKYLDPGDSKTEGSEEGLLFGKAAATITETARSTSSATERRDPRLDEIKRKLKALERRHLK